MAFDDQIVTSQVRGGISRYVVELVVNLPALDAGAFESLPLWRWVKNEDALKLGLGRRGPFSRERLLKVLNRPLARYLLDRRRPEMLHHTFYAPAYLHRQVPKGCRRVVTVYDMIPEIHPELFPSGNPHMAKREYVDQADLIICISEATKRDLILIYGEPSAPVIVTPLAAGEVFRPGLPALADAPAQYVLFVGRRSGYKDFSLLLDAYQNVASRSEGLHLVAVGGGSFSEPELEDLRRRGLDNRVRQLSVDDSGLASLYCHAACFVFPSRYEGFGIPTLEAMACGCPTLLARSSSHIEVGGDAASFFEAGSVADLIAKLSGILAMVDAERDKLSDTLQAHAGTFGWRRCAVETAAGYASIAGAS